MTYLSTSLAAGSQRELTLGGSSRYQIQGNRVQIAIDEIANNRGFDNLSGTLAVELWALQQPYMGGSFSGVALASTQLGALMGQHYLANGTYDLNFNQPPAGSWTLCLMLREWEAGAFVTRDHVNFALPYIVESELQGKAPLRVVRNEESNVINVAFASNAEAEKPEVKKAEAKPAQSPKGKAATKPAAAAAENKTRDAKAETKVAKASTKTAAKPAVEIEGKVSINLATMRELEAIKGVSRKVAKAIFDGRPYDSVEGLLAVKGVGKKLLEKIEPRITL